jgi:osmotically-inducible protein OsmY
MRHSIISLFITVAVLLTGCSTIIQSTTDKPLQEDYGKRTIGNVIDDEIIEVKAKVNIHETDPDLASSHIVVVSYNGVVLLAGQVSTGRLRDLAAETVKKIRNVRKVHNEITVSGPISIPARANDSWLTNKIKLRLFMNDTINSGRIKVVTENGVVYLLGLVTRREADLAVESVKRSYGIQRIVRIFEYID